MVIRFFQFSIFALSAYLISCTQAVPEVTSLGSIQFMSSKSPSPFDQDNTGEYLMFSGQCVSLVKKFQFRLDSEPWSDIPAFAPTPSAGEVPPAAAYDVDCSDGRYEFFVFMSQVYSYISTHIGGVPEDYDPARVEVQGLTQDDVVVPGTITFQRPLATGFKIEPSEYSNSAPWWIGTMETNQTIRFKVTLVDDFGKRTRRFSTESNLNLNFTTSLVSGTSTFTGEAFAYDGTNCLAGPQTTFTFVAGSGEDSIEICFKSMSVTAGATIKLTLSSPGFPSQEKQFTVLNPYQVFSNLVAGNGYQQKIPRTLIRGATYKLRTDLNPLDSSSGQYVNGYNGTHKVNSSSSFVDFLRGNRLYDCGAVETKNSQIECSTSFMKSMPFFMSLQDSYPSSSLNLSLVSNPIMTCPTCQIHVPPSNYFPIAGYQTNNINFEVVSGSINYAQPKFEFYERVQNNVCHSISISLANGEGNTIPANNTNQIPLSLQTSAPGVHFFQNSSCSAITNRGPNNLVKKIVPKANGQYFIIGTFTQYNDISRQKIALINKDGSLDLDFDPIYIPSTIYDVLPLDDGRVLIAGDFIGGLKLLTENGQHDTTMDVTVNGAVYSISRSSIDINTEHFYIAGSFSEISTPTNIIKDKLFKLIRQINPATGIESFSIGSESVSLIGTYINKTLIHDGYLYLAGNFTSPIPSLVRFNTASSLLDTSWPSVTTGFSGDIYSIAADSLHSRILIGGNFTAALGLTRSHFAAINISSGLLQTYTTNPVFNAPVNDIATFNNHIYASGSFTTVNGSSSHNKIVKFTNDSTDLTIDSSWIPTINNSSIYTLSASDQDLLLGGNFTVVNGESNNYFYKMKSTDASNTKFNNNALNSIALGFNRFDLIKQIYIRSSSGHTGEIPIVVSDGVQSFSYTIKTDD